MTHIKVWECKQSCKRWCKLSRHNGINQNHSFSPHLEVITSVVVTHLIWFSLSIELCILKLFVTAISIEIHLYPIHTHTQHTHDVSWECRKYRTNVPLFFFSHPCSGVIYGPCELFSYVSVTIYTASGRINRVRDATTRLCMW